MQSVNEARAVPGKVWKAIAISITRNLLQTTAGSGLTLIEAEAIEAFKREFNVDYGLATAAAMSSRAACR